MEEQINTQTHQEPVRPVEKPQPAPQVTTEPSASAKPSTDKFWKITTVVLIVLLVAFMWKGGSPAETGNGGTGAVVANPPTNNPPPTINMEELLDDDYVLGDANAPVTIVEFSDYECPFCGRFYSQTLGQIKSQYINTGKVKLVYRDFPLSFHPQAEPTAIAANCAGEQGKYYEFHDKAFENQGLLSDSSRKLWAQELGLDIGKWETCLNDPAQKAEVRDDFLDGQNAGITGTPGFVINGRLISGAQPFSVFEQVIEAELN